VDLIQILRHRIDALEVGDYTAGLRAVLQHVQVAASHFSRGSASGDDTAFTDAIYRTNQAFEGSLKEAYRVLAGNDPSRVRPFDIENFFQGKSILRPRVLEQFSTYRTDWRNPSAHDYKLDFDEDEALLAIVSVCAFAIVLIDQIAGKVSYDKARTSAATPPEVDPQRSLSEIAVDALLEFQPRVATLGSGEPMREVEVIGAIAGHLAKALPGARIDTEVRLSVDGRGRADIVVTDKNEKLLIEVKRGRHAANIKQLSIAQVSHYVALSGIKDAVLYFYDEDGDKKMEREEYTLPGSDARIVILRPSRQEKSS
jgi:hypothetical protein